MLGLLLGIINYEMDSKASKAPLNPELYKDPMLEPRIR